MRDLSDAPFLVIWEVTQSCDLACRHCRASAQCHRHPLELTTDEGRNLLRQVRGFGNPLMVFTGGDPLKRPDLFELLAASVECGLRTTVTPSATPLLDASAIERFHSIGVSRMAISIDGPTAAQHDDFRQVPGSWRTSIDALRTARSLGLETQVNTTVTRRNLPDLDAMAALAAREGARLWSVFFLVVTGRAQLDDDLTAEEYEDVFARLHSIARSAPFDIKTTEAQHYRRYVAQQHKNGVALASPLHSVGAISRQAGINDGKGFLFVSHTGEIYPSGFLPLSAGNVRLTSLQSAYRDSPLFRALREPSRFGGKCGVCEYRNLCGGSRSRAYSLTGDHLGSDPRCVYVPPAVAGAGTPPPSA